MLIHGFSLVNARLLNAFGIAFYAIILIQTYRDVYTCLATFVATLRYFTPLYAPLRHFILLGLRVHPFKMLDDEFDIFM